jgi:CTP synthase
MVSNAKPKTKVIVITRSSNTEGKTLIAASLANILNSASMAVNILKIATREEVEKLGDTREIWVTPDGEEVDGDIGVYSRFAGFNYTSKAFLQIDSKSFNLQQILSRLETEGFNIIEVGGTLSQLQYLSDSFSSDSFDCLHIHIVGSDTAEEDCNELEKLGITPDYLVINNCSESYLPSKNPKINYQNVVLLPRFESQFEAPYFLFRSRLMNALDSLNAGIMVQSRFRGFWLNPNPLTTGDNSTKIWTIGIIKKYPSLRIYDSILAALSFSAYQLGITVKSVFLESDSIDEQSIKACDAVILPGGFGSEAMWSYVNIIQLCLKSDIPTLGICLGFQMMCKTLAIEAGVKKAVSEEMIRLDNLCKDEHDCVIEYKFQDLRLGLRNTKVGGLSCLSLIYDGLLEVQETYWHRLGLANDYVSVIQQVQASISATTYEYDNFGVAVEIPKKKFFVGVQYHPEFNTFAHQPHPIFTYLLGTMAGIEEYSVTTEEFVEPESSHLIGLMTA